MPPSAAVLLETEHAVVRVIAAAVDEEQAYPALVEAIGGSLGWSRGRVREGELEHAGANGATVAFGVRGSGRSLEFDAERPGERTLAALDSLGTQIGVFVERCRVQQALRESDARKGAILEAAFDCIV